MTREQAPAWLGNAAHPPCDDLPDIQDLVAPLGP